jgi:Na+/phosphate symporter
MDRSFPSKPLQRSSAAVLVIGWVVVLTGLGFVSVAAQLIGHSTLVGRFLPVFWGAPIFAVLTALRHKVAAVGYSTLAAILLAVGAVIDVSRHHPIAGRYELWMAGSGILVTLAGYLAHVTAPTALRDANPEQNLQPS